MSTTDETRNEAATDDGSGISRRSFLARGAAAGGAVVLAGTAGAALTACGSSGSSGGSGGSSGTPGVGKGQPVKGGSLTVGTMAEIDGFYPPNNHWDTNGFNYANAIYDPLIAVDTKGNYQPYLCKSITPNAAYDTWTMTLRPGVKFSDGSALTAAVVVANYDALKASLLTGQALKQVTSVTATDDMTVVYKLEAPNPTFPLGLSSQLGYVVGQAMIDAVKAGNANAKPIGTGPFIFQSWQPNDHFTATRNPNYWRQGLPYLDQITFKPIPDTIQRESTLKTGGVDMMISTDPGTIKRFQDQSSYQLVDTRTGVIGEPTVAYISLNTAVAPTDDIRVRQALAYALDTAALRKIFGQGITKAITGLFLPGSPYYSETSYPSFDLAKAKSLISAYKADKGTPSLTLTTIPDPRIVQVSQAIQQMWTQAGCQVQINPIQQADLVTDLIVGKFQAITAYQFGTVDPDLNYVWWSTTTVSPPGKIGLNFPRNSDPVIEQNMLTGRHTTDQAARVKAYQTVNERLATDLPYLWLQQWLFSEVADARVQNFANPTLPDGGAQYAFDEGIFVPTQVWLAG